MFMVEAMAERRCFFLAYVDAGQFEWWISCCSGLGEMCNLFLVVLCCFIISFSGIICTLCLST